MEKVAVVAGARFSRASYENTRLFIESRVREKKDERKEKKGARTRSKNRWMEWRNAEDSRDFYS